MGDKEPIGTFATRLSAQALIGLMGPVPGLFGTGPLTFMHVALRLPLWLMLVVAPVLYGSRGRA